MNQNFQRIIEIARRTGDRVIVTDQNGEDPVVIMGLDQYEAFLSEKMHINKPAHRNAQEKRVESNDVLQEVVQEESQNTANTNEPPSEIWTTMKAAAAEGETWDLAKLSADELADLEEQYRAFSEKSKGKALELAEKEDMGEQEIVEDVREEDAAGEEQFYLEPID